MNLPPGLYDQLITGALALRLEQSQAHLASVEDLNSRDAPLLLSELVKQTLVRVLEDFQNEKGTSLEQQLSIVNALLVDLRSRLHDAPENVDALPVPARKLRALYKSGNQPPEPPWTGLAEPWLFTAAKSSPSLLHELRLEAAACDQIDILVSFITVSGVRKLIDVLKSITAADASGLGRTKIRVLTTTYTGATELEALNQLAALNGCEIKISLDGRRTRLHAKAWIFNRATGFGSAYVGSANLSGAALLGGLEWTVKFTEHGQEALFARAKAQFDTLWADDEFQKFDPSNEWPPGSVINF